MVSFSTLAEDTPVSAQFSINVVESASVTHTLSPNSGGTFSPNTRPDTLLAWGQVQVGSASERGVKWGPVSTPDSDSICSKFPGKNNANNKIKVCFGNDKGVKVAPSAMKQGSYALGTVDANKPGKYSVLTGDNGNAIPADNYTITVVTTMLTS